MKKEKNTITMAHGAGGDASKELINKVFRKEFSNKALDSLDDAEFLSFSCYVKK